MSYLLEIGSYRHMSDQSNWHHQLRKVSVSLAPYWMSEMRRSLLQKRQTPQDFLKHLLKRCKKALRKIRQKINESIINYPTPFGSNCEEQSFLSLNCLLTHIKGIFKIVRRTRRCKIECFSIFLIILAIYIFVLTKLIGFIRGFWVDRWISI